MAHYKTEQEVFWAEEFGEGYMQRNAVCPEHVAACTALWSKVLSRCSMDIASVLELGANIGLNMHSLRHLLPKTQLSAVEINSHAAAQLRGSGLCEVFEKSILEFSPDRQWDFVFTSGVLIHINPEYLPTAYALMRQSSRRYVYMCEYYNPTPLEVSYRGHAGRLFKRDFAGEFLDSAPEYHLVDYGFVYRRGKFFPKDDATWFLMEK